jgi:hypothetical protein
MIENKFKNRAFHPFFTDVFPVFEDKLFYSDFFLGEDIE